MKRRSWVGPLAVSISILLSACGSSVGSTTHPNASPSPTSQALLFHDDLSTAVTGRPSLQDSAIAGMSAIHIHNYLMVTTSPSAPSNGKVFLVNPALAPSSGAVAKALGVSDVSRIQYDPQTGSIQYAPPPGVAPLLGVSGPVTDESSAIKLARDFLVARGFFSRAEVDSMPGSAKRFMYAPNPAFWSVRLVRTLGATPSDLFWSGAGASLQIQEEGVLQLVMIQRSPIAGFEPATLIDATTAWQQVKAGHWFYFTGLLNNGAIDVPTFRADTAQVCYLEGGTWLLPMWCFADHSSVGSDYPLWLFYPALTPGTFDWTVPNRT